MDKNINDRVQQVIDTLCKNNSDFCRRIGKKADAVKDIIGGKKTYPSYEFIYAVLSSDLGINPTWLLLGEGEMLVNVPNPETHKDGENKVVLNDIHDNPTVIINYLQSAIKDAIREAYKDIKNEEK